MRYKLIIFFLIPYFLVFQNCYSETSPYYRDNTSLDVLIDEVAFTLYQNINTSINKSYPIAYSTFVEIDDFDKTSTFGIILGDSIGDYLCRRGFKVVETQFREASLFLNKKAGQVSLSRDRNHLREKFDIQAVVAGSYKLINSEKLYISAKLISTIDNSILSSCSFQFGIHEDLVELFQSQTIHSDVDSNASKHSKEYGKIESGQKMLGPKSKEDIKLIQERFSELGLYKFKIDGIWGERTQNALIQFKKIHRLPNPGIWDIQTQKELFQGTGM